MNGYMIKASVWLDRDGLHSALWAILYNITTNQFILKDESGMISNAPHDDILKKSRVIGGSEGSVIWYVYKNSAAMKVEIKGRPECSIAIIPIAPYKIRRSVDSEAEVIDLGFYIQCCIELCENFVVSELKTG